MKKIATFEKVGSKINKSGNEQVYSSKTEYSGARNCATEKIFYVDGYFYIFFSIYVDGIYVSSRKADETEWSVPVKIDSISVFQGESDFAITNEGSYFYYVVARNLGSIDNDIRFKRGLAGSGEIVWESFKYIIDLMSTQEQLGNVSIVKLDGSIVVTYSRAHTALTYTVYGAHVHTEDGSGPWTINSISAGVLNEPNHGLLVKFSATNAYAVVNKSWYIDLYLFDGSWTHVSTYLDSTLVQNFCPIVDNGRIHLFWNIKEIADRMNYGYYKPASGWSSKEVVFQDTGGMDNIQGAVDGSDIFAFWTHDIHLEDGLYVSRRLGVNSWSQPYVLVSSSHDGIFPAVNSVKVSDKTLLNNLFYAIFDWSDDTNMDLRFFSFKKGKHSATFEASGMYMDKFLYLTGESQLKFGLAIRILDYTNHTGFETSLIRNGGQYQCWWGIVPIKIKVDGTFESIGLDPPIILQPGEIPWPPDYYDDVIAVVGPETPGTAPEYWNKEAKWTPPRTTFDTGEEFGVGAFVKINSGTPWMAVGGFRAAWCPKNSGIKELLPKEITIKYKIWGVFEAGNNRTRAGFCMGDDWDATFITGFNNLHYVKRKKEAVFE